MKCIIIGAVLGAIAIPALAATALFTGHQEMITTVTYQQAWNCEYQYNGQKFWRVFKSSCPPMIEIQ